MAAITIILGNKAYSSWSLRGWLMLTQTGVPFEEIVIPLDRPDSHRRILEHSPSGRVPALKVDGLLIWDTLAIAEFLNERFPDANIWPAGTEARAQARTVSAEMHAGFATLRERLPMDLRREAPAGPPSALSGDLKTEVDRVVAIWADCRARFGGTGDFLFGEFTAADAFYAPVVTRFVTYGVDLGGAAAAYRDAVMAWPAMRAWITAAKAEPWVIENP